MSSEPDQLQGIARRALDLIPAGSAIGLGTGRAATAFLHALGEKVRQGFDVRGVPTSHASAELATKLGIPLTTLAQDAVLEVDVDGADEVDPQGNLIKGYGGALVREKIVATAAKRLVILVGEEKLVPVLGRRGNLPIEVIPFALETSQRALSRLGFESSVRQVGGKPHLTDNGNLILDCRVTDLADAAQTERRIRAIPGVVGTGLFLNMHPIVLVQSGDRVFEHTS
jgi:ribose 5-phosphate isomerase A